MDEDLVDWFKARVNEAGGGNYQTLINAALREYVEQKTEPMEDLIRRVVREELKAVTTSARK